MKIRLLEREKREKEKREGICVTECRVVRVRGTHIQPPGGVD